MTKVRRGPVAVVVVLLLASLASIPGAQAAQIITDPPGDTAVEGNGADMPEADITGVAVTYDEEAGKISLTLQIGANLDPSGPAYQRALMERIGYGVWWADSNGTAWGFYAAPNALPNNDINMGFCEGGSANNGADQETSVALNPGETSEITWTVNDFKDGAWDFSGFLAQIHGTTWQTVTNTGEGGGNALQTAPTTCNQSVHSDVDRAPDSGAHPRFVTGAEAEFTVSPAEDEQSVEKGSSVSYDVTIENEGAVEGNVTLEAANADGWDVAVDPAEGSLASGSSFRSTVTVTPAQGAAEFTRSMTKIRALDGEEIDDVGFINTTVTGGGGGGGGPIALSADFTSGSVAIGGSTSYDITVTNNQPSETTVELSVSGDNDWASLGSSSLTIPGGESDTVTLSVEVPSDASAGSVTHTVEAVDAANNTATLELTTTVGQGGAAGATDDGTGASTPGFGTLAVLAAAGAVAFLLRRDGRR